MEIHTVKCNGKLGNSYQLYIKHDIQTIDNTNYLDLIFGIDLLDSSNKISLNKNKSVLRLLIDNKEVKRYDMYLDFNKTTKINILHTYRANNIDTKILQISGILEVFDDSEYLENTSLSFGLSLPKIQKDKYSIKLSNVESNKESIFTIITNNNFDFIEKKVDINPWEKTANTFQVEKTERIQYIQVRGKKDSNYYYSNVIRLNPRNTDI